MHLVMTMAVFGLLGPPQERDAGAGEVRTAWYDLRPVASWCPERRQQVDMRVHVRTIPADHGGPSRSGSPLSPDAHAEWRGLLADLEQVLELDREEAALRLVPYQGRLRFTGTGTEHEVLSETLALMEAVALDGALVEVFRLNGPNDLPGVIPAAEFEGLLAAGRTRLLHGARTTLGRTTVLGGEVHQAHSSQVWPMHFGSGLYLQGVVAIATSGSRVGFRVDRAAQGNSVIVRAWGRDGDPPLMRRVPLDHYAGTELMLPSIGTRLFSGSARLAPGEAMVLRCGAAGNSTYAIRAHPDPRPAQAEGGAIIFVGEYTIAPFGADSVSILDGPFYPDRALRGTSSREVGSPTARPSVGESTDAASFLERGLFAIALVPPVIALGTAAILPRSVRGTGIDVEVRRQAMERRLAAHDAVAQRPSVTVEVAYRLVTESEGAEIREEVRRPGAGLGHWAESEASTRLTGAALAGDVTFLVGGTGHRHLANYTIDGAGGQRAPWPEPEGAFEGFAWACSPVSAGEDHVTLEIEAAYRGPFVPRDINKQDHPGDEPWPYGPAQLEAFESDKVNVRTRVETDGESWSLVALEAALVPGTSLAIFVRARAEQLR